MQVAADGLARVRGVRKRYGDVLAVDGIDLDLRAGQVTALLGANGAGKSTLVGMLLGLLTLTQLSLGIANVLLGLPLKVAVMHNGGAALLLLVLVTLLARLAPLARDD